MQVGLVTHPECSRHTAALPPKHFWSFLETNPRIWFDPWEPGCAIITRGSSTAGMKHAWVTFAVPSRSSLCFTVLYTDSVVIIMLQQLFLNPRYFGLRIFVFAQRGSLLHASMVLYLARHAQTRGALQGFGGRDILLASIDSRNSGIHGSLQILPCFHAE